ncbi:hypothetical protein [Streptococcus jiangjianxini]
MTITSGLGDADSDRTEDIKTSRQGLLLISEEYKVTVKQPAQSDFVI